MRWPEGFESAGLPCGIKRSGKPDLGILVSDEAIPWAGVFTPNGAAAPSVHHCKSLLGGRVRVIVVNSGNANACTGEAGVRAVEIVAGKAALELGCPPEEVLIASTGPIGVPLPAESIVDAVPKVIEKLSSDAGPFAESILTTDTGIKTAEVDLGNATVTGVAKGAGMLAPNMATMLAFVATDARVPPRLLQQVFSGVVSRTFNRVVVDGCESTNDSAFLLSSGRGTPVDRAPFAQGLHHVCADLARQMAEDGEGATKLFRVHVAGADSEAAAVALGRAVASSALWRAAVNGAQPDWGRIVAALGSVDRSLNLTNLTISIGGVPLMANGRPTGQTKEAAEVMRAKNFEVNCEMGRGKASANVLSADLSSDYVRINARGPA